MTRSSFARSSIAAVLVAMLSGTVGAGCARGAGEPEDGGPRGDVGPRPGDARAAEDGGPSTGDDDGGRDAALETDGGIGVDAGDPIDAGSTDGGAVDGGGADGGPITESDGGPLDRCADVDCSSLTTACAIGVCSPSTGACSALARDDGTSCEDGSACTTSDTCVAGACRPGAELDCSGLTTACATGVCSPATGCRAMAVADGTGCAAGPCATGACTAGACATAPIADCGGCGGGLFCAGGTCGASPTTLTYGFESGALPPGWANGTAGATPWIIEAGGAHGGTFRARSGAPGPSAHASLGTTVTLASFASISFWLMTSSEPGFDVLVLYVDGAPFGWWSGDTGWTHVAFDVMPGTHTIEWRYAKDGSFDVDDDAVWIDDVVIGAPVDPSSGFEGGAIEPEWGGAGFAYWSIDAGAARSGSSAAGSGVVAHDQWSSLMRTVSLPTASTMSFWYRVSSEARYDLLQLYVDGALRDQWSGEIAWTLASYPLTAGVHSFEWRYVKDDTVSAGADRAWIDDVSFGFATPDAGPLCGP
jgi:hypothetical protein